MPSTVQQPAVYVQAVLHRLGVQPVNSGACSGEWIEHPAGGELISYSPVDGSELARVRMADERDYETVVNEAAKAFESWRLFPAPKRGQIVREIADELRKHKDDLGALVTLEMGKLLPEGLGEVQEMIDVADFAVGLSRQLYGLTMPSERPGHRMYELWHPLGIAGVITAFNFPVAVWSWNALIALVCGDTVLWKPSSMTPLTAVAVQHICNRVLDRHGWKGVCNLVIGSRPFNKAYLPFIWRGWYDFGCGSFGDMGCYSFGGLFSILDLTPPTSVESSASDFHPETYPLASMVHLDFPANGWRDATRLSWYDGKLTPPRPAGLTPEDQRRWRRGQEGILYVGDKGMIVAGFSGEQPRMYPETKHYDPPKNSEYEPEEHDPAVDQWVKACKGGPAPLASFETQAAPTESFLLGCIAQRMAGEKLEWDSAAMKVTSSQSANRYIDPPYRGNWG